jgi:hypothetical protein
VLVRETSSRSERGAVARPKRAVGNQEIETGAADEDEDGEEREARERRRATPRRGVMRQRRRRPSSRVRREDWARAARRARRAGMWAGSGLVSRGTGGRRGRAA